MMVVWRFMSNMLLYRHYLLCWHILLLLSTISASSAFVPHAGYRVYKLYNRQHHPPPPPLPLQQQQQRPIDNTLVFTVVASLSTLRLHSYNNPNNDKNHNDLQETNQDSTTPNNNDEYRNALTRFLSQFLPSQQKQETQPENSQPLIVDVVDWKAPKIPKLPLATLAELLDAELWEREWFVTGNVNASFFSDDFEFQDPDVKVKGIQDYASGVVRLFDQATSRAEIISTVVNTTTTTPLHHQQPTNVITVTWRLSGKVKVGPGLVIKPYICYTDFLVDEQTGLIRFQEDRFDLPGWDIVLSALFPFLIGIVTAPPAPPVPLSRRKQPLSTITTTTSTSQ